MSLETSTSVSVQRLRRWGQGPLFLLPPQKEDEGRLKNFLYLSILDVSVSHREKSWELLVEREEAAWIDSKIPNSKICDLHKLLPSFENHLSHLLSHPKKKKKYYSWYRKTWTFQRETEIRLEIPLAPLIRDDLSPPVIICKIGR